jgi:hypothetical protein
MHAGRVRGSDLVFHRRRDQHVDRLLHPCGPWQNLISEAASGGFVDGAKPIGDAHQRVDIEPAGILEGVRLAVFCIPR